MTKNFQNELRELINRHSLENHSNTPDFILAGFLIGALSAFETASNARSDWYGREDKPGQSAPSDLAQIMDGTYEKGDSVIDSKLASDHPVNQLRVQIDWIGNIGNRKDIRDWKDGCHRLLCAIDLELSTARRRLGPAGYKILEEHREIKRVCAEVYEAMCKLDPNDDAGHAKQMGRLDDVACGKY